MYEFNKPNWSIYKDNQDGAEYILSDGVKFGNIVCAKYGNGINANANWDIHKHIISSAPELLQACIKSMEVFKQLADVGRYPEPLMAENGGEGWKYLTSAIEKALNITDPQIITATLDKDVNSIIVQKGCPFDEPLNMRP